MLDRLLPCLICPLSAFTRVRQRNNSSQRLGSCHPTAIPSAVTFSTSAIGRRLFDPSGSARCNHGRSQARSSSLAGSLKFARRLAHVLHTVGIRGWRSANPALTWALARQPEQRARGAPDRCRDRHAPRRKAP
jgi:hypothetical protein